MMTDQRHSPPRSSNLRQSSDSRKSADSSSSKKSSSNKDREKKSTKKEKPDDGNEKDKNRVDGSKGSNSRSSGSSSKPTKSSSTPRTSAKEKISKSSTSKDTDNEKKISSSSIRSTEVKSSGTKERRKKSPKDKDKSKSSISETEGKKTPKTSTDIKKASSSKTSKREEDSEISKDSKKPSKIKNGSTKQSVTKQKQPITPKKVSFVLESGHEEDVAHGSSQQSTTSSSPSVDDDDDDSLDSRVSEEFSNEGSFDLSSGEKSEEEQEREEVVRMHASARSLPAAALNAMKAMQALKKVEPVIPSKVAQENEASIFFGSPQPRRSGSSAAKLNRSATESAYTSPMVKSSPRQGVLDWEKLNRKLTYKHIERKPMARAASLSDRVDLEKKAASQQTDKFFQLIQKQQGSMDTSSLTSAAEHRMKDSSHRSNSSKHASRTGTKQKHSDDMDVKQPTKSVDKIAFKMNKSLSAISSSRLNRNTVAGGQSLVSRDSRGSRGTTQSQSLHSESPMGVSSLSRTGRGRDINVGSNGNSREGSVKRSGSRARRSSGNGLGGSSRRHVTRKTSCDDDDMDEDPLQSSEYGERTTRQLKKKSSFEQSSGHKSLSADGFRRSGKETRRTKSDDGVALHISQSKSSRDQSIRRNQSMDGEGGKERLKSSRTSNNSKLSSSTSSRGGSKSAKSKEKEDAHDDGFIVAKEDFLSMHDIIKKSGGRRDSIWDD
jgi:trimeric autotransporter adhesin